MGELTFEQDRQAAVERMLMQHRKAFVGKPKRVVGSGLVCASGCRENDLFDHLLWVVCGCDLALSMSPQPLSH